MNLKPSTITRFLEKLLQLQFIERTQEGRSQKIYATEKGTQKSLDIKQALGRLYDRYCALLGEDFAVRLTADIHLANLKLEEKEK